jgi:hypothetical protein
VGNNYPGTDAQLQGCVNDAVDWSELLVSQGYEVTMRHEATLGDTIGCLMELVAKAKWGDRIVFTYSGHGTWVPDRDGDEADGRDEAMVMADYRQGGLLMDDTVQLIFGDLRAGVGGLILSDSCHSGTVSRFLGDAATPKERPRFYPPSNIITGLTEERAKILEQRPASTPRATASLISGCGDLEYSYDAVFNNRPNGAFTRAAIDTYKPGVSLGRWFTAIREELPSDWYPQTPQLTAASPYRKYIKAL